MKRITSLRELLQFCLVYADSIDLDGILLCDFDCRRATYVFFVVYANLVSFIQFLYQIKFQLQFRGMVQTQVWRRRLGNERKAFILSPGGGRGVCSPPPITLTLLKTKICDFRCPIYDLTKNSIPSVRLDPPSSDLPYQISSLVHTYVKGLWRAFVYCVMDDCEKVASAITCT